MNSKRIRLYTMLILVGLLSSSFAASAQERLAKNKTEKLRADKKKSKKEAVKVHGR